MGILPMGGDSPTGEIKKAKARRSHTIVDLSVSKGIVHRVFWYTRIRLLPLTAFADADHAWLPRVHVVVLLVVLQLLGGLALIMALSIADQIALDDALVAPADRLKIGKCNLCLSSDITSKEATLQVGLECAKAHSGHPSNLPRVVIRSLVRPTPWTEIIIFLASLGHTGDIRKLSDVNVNKLLLNMEYHCCKNVDYAYLLWEDFIFKIENKSMKKGSAMYYPRFTKIVVNYVMEKDPSIPRRNKVNWHYARDDPMFTTINVISRNEATQLYGAILPKSGTENKTSELEGIYLGRLDRGWKQLNIVIKRSSSKKLIALYVVVLVEMKDTGVNRGSDDPDYDSDSQHEVMREDYPEEKKMMNDIDDDENDQEMMLLMCVDATVAKVQGEMTQSIDSYTDRDGRDQVLTDVEDTHVTLTQVKS
ncbi:hypothetical protein Tco_1282749 [Tanacetum coccineum]